VTIETVGRTLGLILADDDDDIRNLVAIAVARAGFELIDELSDGDAAWEAIQSFAPDIVVLDVAMPGKTGIEISRLIRADPVLSGIRVILLSAAVDQDSQQVGLDAGADEYFTKPFSPRDLARRLADVAVEITERS
jgi:DNA-binding response OmpR family regulator